MKFAELSTEAKACALELNRYVLIDDDIYCESAIEQFEKELEDVGFTDANICYEGFEGGECGVNFTSGDIDIEKFLLSQERFGEFHLHIPKYGTNKIGYTLKVSRHNSDAFNEENLYVEKHISFVESDAQEGEVGSVAAVVAEFAHKKSREIYTALEALFYASIKDEAVISHLSSDDYDFDKNGALI